jgi:hypothetical protein
MCHFERKTQLFRTATVVVVIAFTPGRTLEYVGCTHPSSQERSTENSDHPHSMQTLTSGDGVMGG